jgi:hypothetical protein
LASLTVWDKLAETLCALDASSEAAIESDSLCDSDADSADSDWETSVDSSWERSAETDSETEVAALVERTVDCSADSLSEAIESASLDCWLSIVETDALLWVERLSATESLSDVSWLDEALADVKASALAETELLSDRLASLSTWESEPSLPAEAALACDSTVTWFASEPASSDWLPSEPAASDSAYDWDWGAGAALLAALTLWDCGTSTVSCDVATDSDTVWEAVAALSSSSVSLSVLAESISCA